MADTGIGASVRLKEDQRFLTGRGRNTDDLSRSGLAYAVFLRSLDVHAAVASTNTDAAVGSSPSSQARVGNIDKGKKIAVHFSAAAVDDFGRMTNPMIVGGRIHGGIVQSVGRAMVGNRVYDADGQLLIGSRMDHCMPRANDQPFLKVETARTPCARQPLRVTGCSEAGTLAGPATIIGAVADAPETRGITVSTVPEKVWRIARAAR